jgi:hypothetical protein
VALSSPANEIFGRRRRGGGRALKMGGEGGLKYYLVNSFGIL